MMNSPTANDCENGVPRRRFLQSGLAALIAGLGLPAGLRAQDRRGATGQTAASAGPLRNVVLCIAFEAGLKKVAVCAFDQT